MLTTTRRKQSINDESVVSFRLLFLFSISRNDNGIQLKAVNHFRIKLNKTRKKATMAPKMLSFLHHASMLSSAKATMTTAFDWHPTMTYCISHHALAGGFT